MPETQPLLNAIELMNEARWSEGITGTGHTFLAHAIRAMEVQLEALFRE